MLRRKAKLSSMISLIKFCLPEKYLWHTNLKKILCALWAMRKSGLVVVNFALRLWSTQSWCSRQRIPQPARQLLAFSVEFEISKVLTAIVKRHCQSVIDIGKVAYLTFRGENELARPRLPPAFHLPYPLCSRNRRRLTAQQPHQTWGENACP